MSPKSQRRPALETDHAWRSHVGRPPQACEAIATPTTASGERLDTHSHRIMRLTIEFADMTGEILRYRLVEGTWIGFANRQSEGPHQMVQTLATLQHVPLDPERFSPPSFGK